MAKTLEGSGVGPGKCYFLEAWNKMEIILFLKFDTDISLKFISECYVL